MNINNVYYARIYILLKIEKSGSNMYNFVKTYKSSFLRDTLVCKRSNGKFYDLIGKKYLNGDFEFSSKIGTEIVDVTSLIHFKSRINSSKENLSRKRIKRLYNENKIN